MTATRGCEAAEHERVVARIEAVVRDLIDIDLADEVLRADEPGFLVPGQIAGVEEPPAAEADDHHDAVGVVRAVALLLAGGGADRRVLGRIGRRIDELLLAAEERELQLRRARAVGLLERQRHAGLHDVPLLDLQLEIGLARIVGHALELAVVVEIADRQAGRRASARRRNGRRDSA